MMLERIKGGLKPARFTFKDHMLARWTGGMTAQSGRLRGESWRKWPATEPRHGCPRLFSCSLRPQSDGEKSRVLSSTPLSSPLFEHAPPNRPALASRTPSRIRVKCRLVLLDTLSARDPLCETIAAPSTYFHRQASLFHCRFKSCNAFAGIFSWARAVPTIRMCRL